MTHAMAVPHWHYFLAMEKDFVRTIEFVEIHEFANFNAFSTQYAKLLQLTCAEIDVVMKQKCLSLDKNCDPRNMDHYRANILRRYQQFYDIEISIPRYYLTIKPWYNWVDGKSPDWWHAYNNVKHNRVRYFEQANQRNTLHALCGLFSIVLLLYHFELYEGQLEPEVELLFHDILSEHPSSICMAHRSHYD